MYMTPSRDAFATPTQNLSVCFSVPFSLTCIHVRMWCCGSSPWCGRARCSRSAPMWGREFRLGIGCSTRSLAHPPFQISPPLDEIEVYPIGPTKNSTHRTTPTLPRPKAQPTPLRSLNMWRKLLEDPEWRGEVRGGICVFRTCRRCDRLRHFAHATMPRNPCGHHRKGGCQAWSGSIDISPRGVKRGPCPGNVASENLVQRHD